jgi:predicted subunit of tRNA(5-methylaminomethyl-2-thiouridylate) methyltransferase
VSKKQAKKLEKNWQRIEQGLPLDGIGYRVINQLVRA